MDLNALLECISHKEAVESKKNTSLVRVRSNKDTVDKMNTGKFTLKGLFKSQTAKASDTQTILEKISQSEKDIVNYEVIKTFLIIYLAEVAIPWFKDHKTQHYLRAMTIFCEQQLTNSAIYQDLWCDFLLTVNRAKAE